MGPTGGVVLHASDEREAFHAAIWASPDDDLLRLVYADWLDEHGEHDAAAFLRLLCAVRTCPPDVDRLRPLVADFRRAMMKLPAKSVEEVCPVPPAVVIGPWVDLEHPANREPLDWVKKRKRTDEEESRRGTPIYRVAQRFRNFFRRAPTVPDPEILLRLVSAPLSQDDFTEAVWEAMLPALSPAAACTLDEVPVLVDVWSGVVMAVSIYNCWIRKPSERWDRSSWVYRGRPAHEECWSQLSETLGPMGDLGEYIRTFGVWEHQRLLLEQVVAEFDPANRPG